jgi:hypothetical protein
VEPCPFGFTIAREVEQRLYRTVFAAAAVHREEHEVDVCQVRRRYDGREARHGLLVGRPTVDLAREEALLVGRAQPAAARVVRDDLVAAAA